jgi:hypothetical protein
MAQHRGLYAHGRTGSASHTRSWAVAQLTKWPSWLVRSAWPSLAAYRHAVANRGARRRMLAGVEFLIAVGDEGGLNMERRMRGVWKRGPLTPSLAIDGRQRGEVEQWRSMVAPGQGRRGGAPPRGTYVPPGSFAARREWRRGGGGLVRALDDEPMTMANGDAVLSLAVDRQRAERGQWGAQPRVGPRGRRRWIKVSPVMMNLLGKQWWYCSPRGWGKVKIRRAPGSSGFEVLPVKGRAMTRFHLTTWLGRRLDEASCHWWPVMGGALGVRQSTCGMEGSSGGNWGMRLRRSLTWRWQLCGGGARLQCSGGRRTSRWEKWLAWCSEAQLGAAPKWRKGEWGVQSGSAHVEEGETSRVRARVAGAGGCRQCATREDRGRGGWHVGRLGGGA